MRFAYIDSQGNEVGIPSLDALALRVELGAITAQTQLYDAQADVWGAAETHEVFHTLTRQGAEGGFVAPPPPGVHAPVRQDAEPEPAEPTSEPEPPFTSELDASFGLDLAVGFSSSAKAVDETQEAESTLADPPLGQGFDLDLTLTSQPSSSSDGAIEFGSGLGGGLLDEDDDDEDIAADSAPAAGGFDFGDMTGGLVLESSDLSGGTMDLESPMSFADTDAGGGLGLDPPLSEYAPSAPPSWMEQDGPASDDSMDFSSSPEVEESVPERTQRRPTAAAEAGERRERPTSRSRPSPPRRRKQVPVGMIAGIVGVVGVVAAGGYLGWTFLTAERGPEVERVPELPPVVIPDIPAELLPVMRDLSEVALAGVLDELRARSEALDIPSEPRQEWLSGEYLANAPRFPEIEQFWLGIERFVDEVRVTDARLFHAQYLVAVQAAGIAADTAAILTERADSGFVATRDDRFAAYAQMDDLINAALDLHLFLIDREAEIQYEPATTGLSRDPVLEAIPSSKPLADEMWGMVDEITGALDRLGTLDRVTTERLFAVLFDRIRRAGIQ